MSYHVQFQMTWYGGGLDPANKAHLERVLDRVAEYVQSEGTYEFEEWGAEFRQVVSGSHALIEYLDAEWATDLLLSLSGYFPETVFGARGIGEELEDVWVLWVRGGQVLPSRPTE